MKDVAELKELIYDIMSGQYNLSLYPVKEASLVENEFAEGKRCEVLYGSVYDANRRVCERLGVDEDEDIEEIINSMYEMARIMCMKTFDYGMRKKEFDSL